LQRVFRIKNDFERELAKHLSRSCFNLASISKINSFQEAESNGWNEEIKLGAQLETETETETETED
jgi:hypothetical protein